jgi:thiamine biosynthesis lipoprotein
MASKWVFLGAAGRLAVAAAGLATASCQERPAPPPASSAPPPLPTVPRAPAPMTEQDAAQTARGDTMPAQPERVTDEGHAMGTHLLFTAYTSPRADRDRIQRAFDAAKGEISRIEALMTTWRPDSEISRINAAAGKEPVDVGQETFDVIAEAVHTSEISEGTFDITFEGLHGLWKFDEDLDPHPPSQAQIKARLPLVGYRHIQLDRGNRRVFLDKAGVKISLGGIAKGYAVDRASAILLAEQIDSFFVQAGGDLYTRGRKPDGSEWSTGIRDPRGKEGSFFAIAPVSDHAFSTAGDYERSYVIGNKRYHHIIDPRTGSPATACRSVTIWAETALVADAIDDAVFILGPEKGLKLVESLDGVGAVIVDAKNNLWVSKRLQGKLRVVAPPTDGP